jgi:hypothetical protein
MLLRGKSRKAFYKYKIDMSIAALIASDVAHQHLTQETIYASKKGTKTYNYNYYCFN